MSSHCVRLKNIAETAVIHYPESHIIEFYGYLPSNKLLLIKIIDNELYGYENVIAAFYRQMQDAKSVGKFFLKEIRDYYQYHRIPAIDYAVAESFFDLGDCPWDLPTALPAICEYEISAPDCWI